MDAFERTTRQQLDVCVVLYSAFIRGEALHGYQIKKDSRITGPSTYRILDRLREHHLVDTWWEDLAAGEGRPRRRYYQLNPAGAAAVHALLEERRPNALATINMPMPTRQPLHGLGGVLHRGLAFHGGAR